MVFGREPAADLYRRNEAIEEVEEFTKNMTGCSGAMYRVGQYHDS
jgi:uncharacterized PurR-regulated membrane protein YhhQ (DUF165 family)